MVDMEIEDAWIHIKCFKCDEDVIPVAEGSLIESKCKCKSRISLLRDWQEQDKLTLPQQTMMWNGNYRDVREWAEKGLQRGYWLLTDYHELKELLNERKVI